MDDLLDAEDSMMGLESLAGGGTRVTIRSTVLRPKIWLGVLAFLGRPVREELRSLKAYLDGTADETLYGIAAIRMEAASNAPQQCRCPERE